jgi:hypothetical protein
LLGTVLSIGAVYLTDRYLGPIEQAEAHCGVISTCHNAVIARPARSCRPPHCSKPIEIGNVIRILSGSYVSPPIVVTRSSQTVTFPAPPGSSGSARIIVEQKTVGGWTFEEEANGITTEVERSIDPHRDLILLRWTTPRC